MKRGTGVLCHISSLPGKYGIGSLGKEAYQFAKLLKYSGVKYWQILPLNQTSFGDSPYQSVFSGSGNPYFIDLDALMKEGLLTKKELSSLKRSGNVDYDALYKERYATLRTAFSRFHFDSVEFQVFIERGYTEDYALFMTAKSVFGGRFSEWEEDVKYRKLAALRALKHDYHEEYLFWQFLQYKFFEQWNKLKAFCNKIGIQIIGDIPLYVACDSADVWANPQLFCLDERLNPEKVAGVPPDYFSKTGQLWGNPVYNWDKHKAENFRWWTARLERALEIYDYVRIDHFRGIDRYFEIPFDAETAEAGEWREGPKDKLFAHIKHSDRIIAEDLGVVDDGLKNLLAKTGFPGMKVLLFAFDGNSENPFLPHNYPENCVCYTGTHDNDTVVGYVNSLSSEEYILFRSRVAAELNQIGLTVPLGDNSQSFARAFVEIALASKARLAIIPIQDLLEADNSCRMNYPGTPEGNWRFRINRIPSAKIKSRLKKLNKKYRR